ncbi:MAG TPA: sigma-54-dependent Fis family transcriptional regulator [Bacteroidetes bacterium]|nr:sigma-54-dependent Fis family transcriptional regulator [Bacteroidota bacterium]HEX04170.1 sigma-54-dependent Fis family transcriptional regulator [Bacteroidota bacterium]
MATYRIGDIEEDRLMISGRDTISEVALIPNGFLLWPVWKFRWPLLFGFLIPSLIIGFYYYLLYRDERKKAWSRLQTEVDNRTRDLHEANTTLNTTKTYLESVFNASEDALITFDSSLAAIRSNHTFMGMFSLSDGDLSSLHTDPELNDKLKVLFPLVQATFSNGNGQSDQYKEFSLGRVLKISSTIMNIPDQPDPQVLLTIRDVSQQFHTKSLGSQSSYPHIIGESELIRKIFNTLDRLKSTETPVLILGESGTGKDLVAQAIHQTSKRRSAPFIAVNCATLVTDLAKSELFGHLKGAFTGATRDHRGYFSQADNGTLFLDEIGDLRPDIQAMLLKVSQTGEYQRMGDEQMRSCDVRIIAATNQPIAEKSGKSGFRRDLFYRFNVVQITMPSLRDRASDIPLLVDHFLTHYSREMEKPTNRVSENSMQILHHYPWPGNIRELSNAIAHAVIFCKGEEIQVRHLPEEISRASLDADSSTNGLHKFSSRARQEWDREYLIAALDHFRWNKRKTAAALDSSPQTLYKYLRKFSIEASR